MKSTLLNELMKIPQDATYVTVLGVEMQVIDRDEAVRLLNFDPTDSNIHECILEKPLNFDPFGHAELSLFAKI